MKLGAHTRRACTRTGCHAAGLLASLVVGRRARRLTAGRSVARASAWSRPDQRQSPPAPHPLRARCWWTPFRQTASLGGPCPSAGRCKGARRRGERRRREAEVGGLRCACCACTAWPAGRQQLVVGRRYAAALAGTQAHAPSAPSYHAPTAGHGGPRHGHQPARRPFHAAVGPDAGAARRHQARQVVVAQQHQADRAVRVQRGQRGQRVVQPPAQRAW